MPVETERKFLVRKDLWYALAKPAGIDIRQGYLVTKPEMTIRVRITDTEAWITIKGAAQQGSRQEFEYSIPHNEAVEILDSFTSAKIEKTRYRIDFAGKTWEVDEFFGQNDGLVIAEIELDRITDEVEYPHWLGEEVTEDHRYSNSALSEHPFLSW